MEEEEEEENGDGEKRSFLGRLRDYFTLAGLAEHLKEKRDFARVGEEEKVGRNEEPPAR